MRAPQLPPRQAPRPTYAEHRAMVLAKATLYRASGFLGSGRYSNAQAPTMAEVRPMAEAMEETLASGKGVLVYAVAGIHAELVATYDRRRGWEEVKS